MADSDCFNRGGLCRCDVTFYGKSCAKFVPPPSIATDGTPAPVLLTYTGRQPSNLEAYRIYLAVKAAKPGGDFIDHGLSITQQLQIQGFGLVTLPPAAAEKAHV